MPRVTSSPLALSLTVALVAGACSARQLMAAEPGPEHAMLQKMEGTWDAVLSVTRGPKSKGEMTCKMECGGLWLVRDFSSSLGPLTIHSKGLDGYDPKTGKHVSIQVDSLTTVPMVLEGTYEDSSKTLTQTGEARDFDGGPELVKCVTKYEDDDHVTVTMYRVHPDGQEVKHLTIEYTRRKPAAGDVPVSTSSAND
jgi:hypothetical protein